MSLGGDTPVEAVNKPRGMSLWDAISMGAQSSLDSIRTDIDRVSSGRSPDGLMQVLGNAPIPQAKAAKVALGAKVFKPASPMQRAMQQNQQYVRTIGNKTFKDALPVSVAKKGATTDTPMEKMFAAMIDPQTGQVIHTRTPYQPGDHGGLQTQAAVMDGFNAVRGFVDPMTMQAFTEAMLEEILMKKHFGAR